MYKLITIQRHVYALLCVPCQNRFIDDVEHTRALHEAHMNSLLDSYVGRKTLQKNAINRIQDMTSGLLVLAGKPGCGKSAFVASTRRFLQR